MFGTIGPYSVVVLFYMKVKTKRIIPSHHFLKKGVGIIYQNESRF
jgi:hypothetical protein